MLTESQIREIENDIEALVDMRVEKQLSKVIPKRFTPGDDQITSGGKFIGQTNEYGTFQGFLRDVVAAAKGYEPDTLRDWQKRTVDKTAGYMEGGDLSQGGYSIPTITANTILEKSLEMEIIRPRAIKQPMTSRRLEIPADVDADHSSNLFGGITIYRTGELQSKTPTNPAMGKIALQIHNLTGLCHVSDELLEDSGVALEAYLTRKFSQAIAFVEDNDFINGTGVNMALGMFNEANPALITVDAVPGQGAGTIIYENIVNMYSRLHPAGQNTAIWIANQECFVQLATMGMAVGAGGIPVYLPSNQAAQRPFRELMGAPVFYSEKAQALGTAGDICLCDPTQYLVGERNNGQPQVASSIHLKFDLDTTSFRFVLRYDGSPTWLSTLTPLHGTKTVSPFIRLSSTRT